MWYLESWQWEQISWLKTRDWYCSLIMHGGRLVLGEQVGWLWAYRWGVAMLEMFSLCRVCVEKSQVWVVSCDCRIRSLCFIDQVFCSWCSEYWRAQWEELRTMSQENACPSRGQFDKLRTMKSRETEKLEDPVPCKCMVIPQRISAFKMSPKTRDCFQLHLCK